jgi:acyl carrier protein
MNKTEILERLTIIFRETLENNLISLNEDTVADEIEGWDSLTHIQLVVTIENDFGIRFSSKEIQSWKNVGALVDNILLKM